MRLSIIPRSLALLGMMALILFAATAHASGEIAQGAAAAVTEGTTTTTTTAAVERPRFFSRKYKDEELGEVRNQVTYWLCLIIQDACQGWWPGPGGANERDDD